MAADGNQYTDVLQTAQTAGVTADGLVDGKHHESSIMASQTAQLSTFLTTATFPGSFTVKGTVDGTINPGFPRWIASFMTFLGDSAIRINAIPSSRRVKPVSPCG